MWTEKTIGEVRHHPWSEGTLAYERETIHPKSSYHFDVLVDHMLVFMEDWTMVPVNNLYETRVKPERCLRPLLDDTKMEPYQDQQMAVLSTLKSIQVSLEFKKDHANHVRRSIELLDSNSLENLRLETLKQSHDAIPEFKRIVHEGQQGSDLAAEVSDLGDEMLTEFVQQLTVMNQIEKHNVVPVDMNNHYLTT